jgi:hypothetical protein
MIITKRALPRRTFLRGIGVTLALPMLDAMTPALAARSGSIAPLRLGFVYVPNGVTMREWIPNGEGHSFEFSRILTPLMPVRKHVTIVTGLSNLAAEKGVGVGFHSKGSTAWLTGSPLKETEGADISAGVSIDQLIARKLGEETALGSLELALEPSYSGALCEVGLSCVYTNTFVWRGPTTPIPMEHNPRAVFERLFGDGSTPDERLALLHRNRSILDWVDQEIASLQRQLGPADRTIVDEYLQSVRDVESRIQKNERQSAVSTLDVGERPIGVPDSDDDYGKLMFDLKFLAYRADVTRVVSLQMGREQSARIYPWLGVPEAHHNVSHHRGEAQRKEWNTRINSYHVGLFARLAEKMRDTPDGDGSLLDHAILLYGGGLADGDQHTHRNLPVVLVGGGCGQLQGDRVVACPADTPMMNLGLALLDKAGVEIDRVGDSTGRLSL